MSLTGGGLWSTTHGDGGATWRDVPSRAGIAELGTVAWLVANGQPSVPVGGALLAGWVSLNRRTTTPAPTIVVRRSGLLDGIGVDVLCVPPRLRSPQEHGSVRLVSTMRMARRERPRQLLSIFADLARSSPLPLESTVAGDGPLRRSFESRARSLDLTGAVTVTGRVTPETVPAHLARADIYLAPAHLESFGPAALEARCAGLLARSGTGLLARSGTGLRDATRLLIEDPASRLRIAERNRTTPSTMTWQRTLARHHEAYAVAISRDGARPTLTHRGLDSTAGIEAAVRASGVRTVGTGSYRHA